MVQRVQRKELGIEVHVIDDIPDACSCFSSDRRC